MKRKPNSTNTNQKSSNPSTKQKSQYLCDEKYVEEKLITKYLKKGFESLSIEELALTIISPTFESRILQAFRLFYAIRVLPFPRRKHRKEQSYLQVQHTRYQVLFASPLSSQLLLDTF